MRFLLNGQIVQRFSRLLLIVATVITLISGTSTSSQAQAIPIDPPPQPEPLPMPIDEVQIEAFLVDVTIDGALAQVHLTQRLRNDTPRTIEGSYLFPLPADAAISDFQMTVDGEVLEGEILRADEARRTYEEIVRQRRDPALLEYIDHDLLQISVFPIPAGATRELAFSYVQLLTGRDGLYQFRFPLQTRQYSAAPVEALALNIELINQPGLRTIYSPSHEVAVERTANGSAQIHYAANRGQTDNGQANSGQTNGDFVLYFGNDQSGVGLNLLSYQPAGEDGFFVLLAAPGLETATDAIVERDVVMVVDVSGSMQGEKFAQAQAAADFVVDSLNPMDRFNLVSFSTGVRLWEAELQTVNETTKKAAHEWIADLRATGGTDINRALLETLAQFEPDSTRPAYILFLTDGLPTQGERQIDRILANVMANQPDALSLRLFAFGLGYDVNTTLLDTLSSDLGGRSSYVRPEERIDEEVSHFYNGISTPVLSDVTITFDGDLVADEIYPATLPDLFAGEQLVVAGRYHGGTSATVTLRGTLNGVPHSYRYLDQPFAAHGGEPAVARLWAARKIGALLQQIRRTGPDDELVDAIVDLGLQYGIVTPYTSAFVPEPGVLPGVAGPGMPGDDEQPVAPPVEVEAAPAQALRDNYRANAPAVAASMSQQSGEVAVKMSEAISDLSSAALVGEGQSVRYIGGKSFLNRGTVADGQNNRLTLWVDLLYNQDMQVETVEFGSDCYFALLQTPGLAEWLALSPELIIVRNEHQALRITTLPDRQLDDSQIDDSQIDDSQIDDSQIDDGQATDGAIEDVTGNDATTTAPTPAPAAKQNAQCLTW